MPIYRPRREYLGNQIGDAYIQLDGSYIPVSPETDSIIAKQIKAYNTKKDGSNLIAPKHIPRIKNPITSAIHQGHEIAAPFVAAPVTGPLKYIGGGS